MQTIDPTRAPASLAQWLDTVRADVDRALSARLSTSAAAGDPAARLMEAMRYATLGPGKRLRPALAVAACEAVGGSRDAAMPVACAIELVHAYTLVHDDLPAMDDDDERRGRPTTHVQFDEATAVLAGDGLLTAGFGALAELGASAADAVAVLAARAGSQQLLAGQARDLAAVGRALGFEELEQIHAGKTGALFSAAAELGAIAGGGAHREALAQYGLAIGVAFQHADDRDDAEHPQHAGRAAERMRSATDEALDLARGVGGRWLEEIAQWIGGTA